MNIRLTDRDRTPLSELVRSDWIRGRRMGTIARSSSSEMLTRRCAEYADNRRRSYEKLPHETMRLLRDIARLDIEVTGKLFCHHSRTMPRIMSHMR